MGILDSVSVESPRVADAALLLDAQISDLLHAGIDEHFALRELGIDWEDRQGHSELDIPPLGIYGAGVTFIRDLPEPAIFVSPAAFDTAAPPRDVMRLEMFETQVGRVLDRFSVKYPSDTVVVSLPPPIEQMRVGDALQCGNVTGTCGLRTTWHGNAAVITAGHVANPVGAKVTAAGRPFGTVVYSDWLGNAHGPQDIVADVAVVALDEGVVVQDGPAVTAIGTVKQYDDVTAWGKNGTNNAWLRYGLLPNFALAKDKGRWGEVAITDRALSVGGDSGAAVSLSGTSTVIGHVVAGASNAYSVVQDITFVAAAAGLVLP